MPRNPNHHTTPDPDDLDHLDLDRRQFLQTGMAAAVTAAAAPASRAQPAPTKRPNLIFLYTEGQRADSLSLVGHPILKTPNMDRIGREGVRFPNAFCTNALCAPARATAMTGLWSRTTGALDNKGAQTPLPADIPVFTDYLREAGYETCIVGKVHLRNGLRERYWDYYLGVNTIESLSCSACDAISLESSWSGA